ncbi:hypothetical protein SAMN05421823_11028 [Catalinimonas alkaloidigena]|uniref:S1/P1 Nuclease n=1 Tax=Catalinimonas alkaloidigena TaxID=1075417 RepID=A0A1G9Q3K6_9BACT|nr:zinc dependent phospholipase C family protein [Catalinimonas alkaloidigena]SDM05590.1 hypothetical protein SAMN05421823_11028 [Catalinimonas alkaloidigena]
MKKGVVLVMLLLIPFWSEAWGFYAHRLINRLAVMTLPPEMLVFYKRHIAYLTAQAVAPDRRRYAVEDEGPRHYIDLDVYGDSALFKVPHRWDQAVAQYTEDTLMAYGIVPWHLNLMRYQLTEAFKRGDARAILRLSAEMGHYAADANVPLHTTQNYNGQLTGQHGIHGFWESRVPELFATDYDLFTGPPQYLENPQEAIWQAVAQAHQALDSVFALERQLTTEFAEDRKYSYEERGNLTVRVYSRDFSEAFQRGLQGQVERQMLASIQLVSNLWYTCWVDAGQPDLAPLASFKFSDQEELQREQDSSADPQESISVRPHEF